jgi:hypothetical protein
MPLCNGVPSKFSIMISTSGSTERTRSKGMLGFSFSGFAEALPKRYAIDMCPTANKRSFSFSPRNWCPCY